MSEFAEISARVATNETRITATETQLALMNSRIERELASQGWVRELVQPIVDNTRETRHAVENQGRDMTIFIAAHNKVMEERQKQEKEEHDAKMAALEAQTWSNILKNKWAPVATFIIALAVILNYVGNALMTYLAVHGPASIPLK